MTAIQDKSIAQLTREISDDWTHPYFGAVPYLQAMSAIDSIDDAYGVESGHDVVAYFLSNANTWRGETAREVKKELKRRCRWCK